MNEQFVIFKQLDNFEKCRLYKIIMFEPGIKTLILENV